MNDTTAFAIALEKWIETNSPNAIAKLSSGSGVSIGTIYNARRGKPLKAGMIRLLCNFMSLDYERFSQKRSA
jgi:hypothetical protein